MTKEELKKYLIEDNQSGYKTRESHFVKNFPEIHIQIYEHHNEFFDEKYKFNQMLYNYLYDITVLPKCLTCSKTIKWRGVFTEGYKEYCNLQCAGKGDKRLLNIKNTLKKKYGNEILSQIDEVKNKKKKTYNKKYGNESLFKTKHFKEKAKVTSNKKYGVDVPIMSDKVKKKRNANNIKKYGVDNPSKLESVKNKMLTTVLDRYGVPSVMDVPEIKQKNITTRIKKTIAKYKEVLGDHVKINYIDSSFIDF
jgi:hypothetical protein